MVKRWFYISPIDNPGLLKRLRTTKDATMMMWLKMMRIFQTVLGAGWSQVMILHMILIPSCITDATGNHNHSLIICMHYQIIVHDHCTCSFRIAGETGNVIDVKSNAPVPAPQKDWIKIET